VRTLSLGILALCTATAVHAQILRVPRGGGESRGGIPIFLSASIGYLVSDAVADGDSEAIWDFGSSAQYRGSVEVGIGNQSSLGVAMTHARMPLRYTSSALPAPAGCGRCDAHATVQSFAAVFHSGGGVGFHQLFDIGAGILRYSKFTADEGDAELPPNGDNDFFFSVGYGLGYGFSTSLGMFLVQDYSNGLHQRSGLPGNARGNTQYYTTRVGLRFGFGNTTR
jgi:hypothetical protein